MRSLVTGGAGFIGSHLVDRLLEGGQEVIVLDNLSTGRLQNLSHLKGTARLQVHEVDVADFESIPPYVEGVDWVFHLAASPCNNCDIEILDLLTPRFDVERFGIQLVGSVRHADAILVTGSMNRKVRRRLKRVLAQAAQPCFVIAIGNCSCSMEMFG